MPLTTREPEGSVTSPPRDEAKQSPTHFLSHLIFLLRHSEQLCTTLLLVAIGFLSAPAPVTFTLLPGGPGDPSSHSSGLAANDCSPEPSSISNEGGWMSDSPGGGNDGRVFDRIC